MLNLLTKMFGTKHEKDIKKIQPIVEEINQIYEEYHSLTDEEIKSKTIEFKEIIRERTLELDKERDELQTKLIEEALDSIDSEKTKSRISEIDKETYTVISETLDEILPEAFAVVKQACKRLKESEFRYDYAGQPYTWDMVPFDVQLIGGIVLHQGKISEMATGEGKTLVAVLPLYLNALAGKGVHLITVNDYLAKRDSDWMRPVYEFLGLKVGAIQSNMETDDRKKYYNFDITYGTNSEFGFDYLRDNMVVELDHMVQRGHFFAIVDEVDSVLIDEARTPLIISGPVGQAADQSFAEMNPRVKRLVDAQNKLVNQIAAEVSDLLAKNTKEDREAAGVKLLTSHRGAPKHKRLMKLLQEPDIMKLLKDTELDYMRDQGRRMREIDEELFYTIDEKNHNIDISEKGRQLLCTSQEDPDMFVIPDIATSMSMIEGDSAMPPEEKQNKIDEINRLYAERSDRIHTISQLLRAYALYERDDEYVIQDGKVMIVDEFTGRILEGRRYSEGLHQAIEAKENVKVQRDTQTLATITLQNYFRLYKKLAGMTGTAETESAEFEKIYKLEVVVIPTNRKAVRKDHDDLIYRTKREKYNAIVDKIDEYLHNGRAVLVGTTSVEVSELISKMLKRKNIPHNVLNAKHHQKEAEIVANAGKKGSITIATNMAGRGTDIKIDHDVRKNGGLVIIGSERHDARRIDRQLRGRSGRQGDPGESQFFISLEDNLMRLFGGERIAGVMQQLKVPEGEPIQHPMITKSVERAQKKVEENNFSIRKRLLEYDDVMNQQREVIYNRRRHALRGERLKGEIFEYIEDMAAEWFDDYHKENQYKEMIAKVRATLLCEPKISEKEFSSVGKTDFIDKVIHAADDFYSRKEKMFGPEFMARLEQVAVLQTIDDKWRDHLREMDDLKEGIHLRAYGQKDPILEYKGEAYRYFMQLIQEINVNSVQFAFRYFPKVVQRQLDNANDSNVAEAVPKLKRSTPSAGAVQYQHSSNIPDYLKQELSVQQAEGSQRNTPIQAHRLTQPKIGRNDMVKVRFSDGSIKEVKYKKVEQDIADGKCQIVN